MTIQLYQDRCQDLPNSLAEPEAELALKGTGTKGPIIHIHKYIIRERDGWGRAIMGQRVLPILHIMTRLYMMLMNDTWNGKPTRVYDLHIYNAIQLFSFFRMCQCHHDSRLTVRAAGRSVSDQTLSRHGWTLTAEVQECIPARIRLWARRNGSGCCYPKRWLCSARENGQNGQNGLLNERRQASKVANNFYYARFRRYFLSSNK